MFDIVYYFTTIFRSNRLLLGMTVGNYFSIEGEAGRTNMIADHFWKIVFFLNCFNFGAFCPCIYCRLGFVVSMQTKWAENKWL